jgi:AcrR family transcriptional regulator
MEKKLTSRQLQAEQTKKLIFEKALELFKVKDYEDVTIVEICRDAQVSVGSFYKYYKSKATPHNGGICRYMIK